MKPVTAAIFRTLAFQAAWDYAPTRIELVMFLDVGSDGDGVDTSSVLGELDSLINSGEIKEDQGRLTLSSYFNLIKRGREKEFYFPRKLRHARRAVKYLRRLPWVRAICLCNTTALGQARDESDLDFFIVVKSGAIWRTRFFSALPFKLIGARPALKSSTKYGVRSTSEFGLRTPYPVLRTIAKDPVCLSFFVADNALDLSSLMLSNDDPYFRYWFLSMLPLYDDGVLHELWEANSTIKYRHPMAKEWMALRCTKYGVRSTFRPVFRTSYSVLENVLKSFQEKNLPHSIKSLINKDTRVVVNDNVLKFHVDDKREKFKQKYYDICRRYDIKP